jgi:hypothetical protein
MQGVRTIIFLFFTSSNTSSNSGAFSYVSLLEKAGILKE